MEKTSREKEEIADLIISSPPYAESNVTGERNFTGGGGNQTPAASLRRDGYGTTPGQLAAMPAGEIADAVVSSPPYEEGLGHGGVKPHPMLTEKNLHAGLANNGYGGGVGNLSNHAGETFWTAARQIVAECFHLLRPGSPAVWVVKDFVRKGKIVPFCDQWRQLCESIGFVTVCQHRAMLVTEMGTQLNLFDEPEKLEKRRESFFRRLARKNGSPDIRWEMVLCMEKRQ